MGFFDRFTGGPQNQAARDASARRQEEIVFAIRTDGVPKSTQRRLLAVRSGTLPWIATLTPAELLITRSHGFRPISAVSATAWMHYGWSWTEGHEQGWHTALMRLREEARAAGANAVLDVKMRTVPLHVEASMDFTLTGTAVYVDGLKSSAEPVVATVPALEFVKLLEADVVPTGIAVGACFEWMYDWRGTADERWSWVNTEPFSCPNCGRGSDARRIGILARMRAIRVMECSPTSISARCSREKAKALANDTSPGTLSLQRQSMPGQARSFHTMWPS